MSEKGIRPPQTDPPIWKLDTAFTEVVAKLNTLRADEKRGGAIEKRTELILSLFTVETGQKESFIEKYWLQGAPFTLWSDANGLRLDIGLDFPQGIHSHIPYEYLSKEVLERITNGPLLETESEKLELRARVAESSRDSVAGTEVAKEQEALFVNTLLANASETSPVSLANALIEEPDMVAGVSIEQQKHIPKEFIRSLLADEEQSESLQTQILSLVRVASALNGGYKGADGDEFYRAQHPDAWRTLHTSSEVTRFNRSVFNSRASTLHTSWQNAEASKIVETIFEQFSYETLQSVGIETVRGTYRDGLEFIGFFSGNSYEHVLLEPKKHIRTEEARKNYGSIPTVTNTDLEAFEGFLLPYIQFQTLSRSLDEILGEGKEEVPTAKRLAEAKAHVNGMLSLLLSDMDPEAYEPFLLAGKELVQALDTEPVDTHIVSAFRVRLDEIQARYGERFGSLSIPDILETYLKIPERSVASFDTDFVENAPEHLRPGIQRFLESLPVQNPSAKIVQSGTESGIPGVHEGRALRALGITARPTLLLITGAKFENVEDQASLDRIAESIISVGKKTGANIFMQGTQSGKIAETIVRKYWEYKTSLAEGVEPFRLIAIEPGKSTYAGSLGYGEDELVGPHPLLPIDTILTPHAAGWSPGQTMHSYLPHVMYRQSVVRHASAGHPVATLILNGGGWSVPESVESIKDGFPQLTIPSSGRLASVLGHLKHSYKRWAEKGTDGALEELQMFISRQPESIRIPLQEDFLQMQERGLQELIGEITSPESIQTTDVDTLEDRLLQMLSP